MKKTRIKNLLYVLIAILLIVQCIFLGRKQDEADTQKLENQFNQYLAQIREDGTYEELYRIWIEEGGTGASIDYDALTGENGTLRFGTTTQRPFSYIENNQRVGFTIDMVYRFCLTYGYGLAIADYSSSSALVSAVQMGKCDFGGNNLSITEDRREMVDFSDPYYSNRLLFVLRAEDTAVYRTAGDLDGKTLGNLMGSGVDERMKKVFQPGEILEFNSISDLCEATRTGKIETFCYDETVVFLALQEYTDLTGTFYLEEAVPDQFGLIFPKTDEEPGTGLLSSLKDSFTRTFVEGERYKILLTGVDTTILISFFSIFMGTLIGFLLYLITDKNNILLKIASWTSNGLPVVVLLMIFYYVVFGNTRMSGLAVSLIVFTAMFALSVISILQNAVGAIDPGQWEACYILGYSKISAFFRIILPQALTIAWSEYKTVVVAQIKNTAIVGYIAVQDLTKAGDMIRNITFESFFPLIMVALVYFLFVGLAIWSVNGIGKLVGRSQKKSKRFLKGVRTHD